MDLREKIAEVLYEAPASDGALAKIACDVALRRAQRRADAVMGVVEGEAERSHALLLMVGHVRAELADYFEEESADTTEGYVARILARVRELEDEGARDDQIIRDLNATIIRRNARIAALEDENQRMRENARLKNRAAYLSAINACMARLQGQTDITAVFPALHEMRDRAVELHNAALSRARETAEEEAHAGSCSHVASDLLLDGSTCARPIGHTGDHSDHKGGMWENTKEEA